MSRSERTARHASGSDHSEARLEPLDENETHNFAEQELSPDAGDIGTCPSKWVGVWTRLSSTVVNQFRIRSTMAGNATEITNIIGGRRRLSPEEIHEHGFDDAALGKYNKLLKICPSAWASATKMARTEFDK